MYTSTNSFPSPVKGTLGLRNLQEVIFFAALLQELNPSQFCGKQIHQLTGPTLGANFGCKNARNTKIQTQPLTYMWGPWAHVPLYICVKGRV